MLREIAIPGTGITKTSAIKCRFPLGINRGLGLTKKGKLDVL